MNFVEAAEITVDKVIGFVAYVVVSVLASIAAVISYNHAYEVVSSYGESGFVAQLVPLVIDGLLVVASVLMLDAARRDEKTHWLAWVALVVGILLTLGANVLHGWAHGPVGAVIAALPAITLTISFELLMVRIRRYARQDTPAVEADAVELPAVVEPEEVQPVEAEQPKEAPKRTIHIAPEHIAAAKAFLTETAVDLNKVTARHLADVFPGMVARTRREILRRAKEEMGVGKPEAVSEATGDMLPGMTPATV